MTSRRYRHAPCQRDFLTSYSSATRHEWLNLFSSRHESFTSDFGLTRTRLVSCVLLTSLLFLPGVLHTAMLSYLESDRSSPDREVGDASSKLRHDAFFCYQGVRYT